MDTDPPNGSAEAKPKTRKIKKQIRKGDLPVVAGTASLDSATKTAYAEKENAMFMEDKLVADTEDKKNELESYIYEMRGKIDDQYAEFASDEEKTKLKAVLEKAEVCHAVLLPSFPPPLSIYISVMKPSTDPFVRQDWLYDEGEDATKAVYTAKMDEIRFVAGPITQRYLDKIEAERQALQKAREEAEAAKRAEREAAKRAEDEAKKAAGGSEAASKDEEMKDADTVQPDAVEEANGNGTSNKVQ